MAALYEYVSSGMSFTKMSSKLVLDTPELKAELSRACKTLQKQDHHFSMLYNAHTESRFGEMFRQYEEGCFKQIYADSGGLQVVTQGLDITQDLKNKVYVNQGTWSDRGMCFDEIPLKFSGGKSSRLDLSNRWFDKDSFEHCAKTTGINVNDQINTFRSMNSACKPVIIMQGNCYDTYMKWAELVYSQISEDNKPFVGGIAMGAAALGHGVLQDIQRAVYYKMLPIDLPSNHMHLLAVGSVKRLLPNLIFARNGFYEDIHLSYDSTTHTSAPHMGRYIAKGARNVDLTRTLNKKHKLILEDIKEVFPHYNISLEDYFHSITGNLTTSDDRFSDAGVSTIRAFVYTILAGIYRFKEEVDTIVYDINNMSKHLDRRELMPYNALLQVKSYDDYLAWERNFKKKVTSHAVADSEPFGLDNFFE